MTNINLKNFDIYVAEGYKVTAQIPEISKKYYNPLEDVEYFATTEDSDKILLVGTVNEPWFAPIDKVLKQYSKVDGSDLVSSDITSEPIDIIRKTSYNAAMELTEDTDVVISAGNVLHAKKGDYLVCSVKEENGVMVPDAQWGYWTINREVFHNTNKIKHSQLYKEIKNVFEFTKEKLLETTLCEIQGQLYVAQKYNIISNREYKELANLYNIAYNELYE